MHPASLFPSCDGCAALAPGPGSSPTLRTLALGYRFQRQGIAVRMETTTLVLLHRCQLPPQIRWDIHRFTSLCLIYLDFQPIPRDGRIGSCAEKSFQLLHNFQRCAGYASLILRESRRLRDCRPNPYPVTGAYAGSCAEISFSVSPPNGSDLPACAGRASLNMRDAHSIRRPAKSFGT